MEQGRSGTAYDRADKRPPELAPPQRRKWLRTGTSNEQGGHAVQDTKAASTVRPRRQSGAPLCCRRPAPASAKTMTPDSIKAPPDRGTIASPHYPGNVLQITGHINRRIQPTGCLGAKRRVGAQVHMGNPTGAHGPASGTSGDGGPTLSGRIGRICVYDLDTRARGRDTHDQESGTGAHDEDRRRAAPGLDSGGSALGAARSVRTASGVLSPRADASLWAPRFPTGAAHRHRAGSGRDGASPPPVSCGSPPSQRRASPTSGLSPSRGGPGGPRAPPSISPAMRRPHPRSTPPGGISPRPAARLSWSVAIASLLIYRIIPTLLHESW